MIDFKGKIFSFDFDGTLAITEYPIILKKNYFMMKLAKEIKYQGGYLILNTMREGAELVAAIDFCKSHGVIFDAVNDNLDIMKQKYKNNPRKIYADYYVDNHNLDLGAIMYQRN